MADQQDPLFTSIDEDENELVDTMVEEKAGTDEKMSPEEEAIHEDTTSARQVSYHPGNNMSDDPNNNITNEVDVEDDDQKVDVEHDDQKSEE